MSESQVSIEGEVMKLPSPFMVITTQNLSESHGTFPLPDSQKDRFMISMGMGMPSPEQEVEILSRSQHGMPEANAVIAGERIVEMREMVKRIEVDSKIRQYIVKLAGSTRSNSSVRHKGSVLVVRPLSSEPCRRGPLLKCVRTSSHKTCPRLHRTS